MGLRIQLRDWDYTDMTYTLEISSLIPIYFGVHAPGLSYLDYRNILRLFCGL